MGACVQAPIFNDSMQKISLIHSQHALFLDFDGTLADIAPHPSAVYVHSDTVPMLHKLHDVLSGALAIVSGRPVNEIDIFLAPLKLPAAGEHGTQLRSAAGDLLELDNRSLSSALGPLLKAAQSLASQHSALLLEQKTAGFALHYRMAPALYNLCWQTLAPLAQHQPNLVLMRGKYVIEVTPSMVDKGTAIQHFLQQPPFAGRTPIFFGDDSTDEAGFAAVQNLGGHGVKVGAGPSEAQHRCPNPSALRAWLAQALSAPQPTAAYTAARQQGAALQPAAPVAAKAA
jgi:trehalose 6-phosphate phosphatase